MKILLIDIDSHNFPNLSLMKLSSYLKKNNHDVSFLKLTKADKKYILDGQAPFFENEYDVIYAACVFEENREIANMLINFGVIVGGTGITLNPRCNLPDKIENMCPDYELYGDEFSDIAYGFLTRGCIRNCPFCIVCKKEGNKSVKVANLNDFWQGQKIIKLLDPNLLAVEKLYKKYIRLAKLSSEDNTLDSQDFLGSIKKINDRNIILAKLDILTELLGYDTSDVKRDLESVNIK